MHHLNIKVGGKSINLDSSLSESCNVCVAFLRVNKLNVLQKKSSHTGSNGVYDLGVITFKKKNVVLKKSFVFIKRQMSAFPLSERVLLYVWKVVRVVIQRGCRRWCMLAARQTVEKRATAGRFLSFCVSLFDQASPGPQERSFDTSRKKEQCGHYRSYLIPTLQRLSDNQGQTASGPRPAQIC